MSTNTQTRQPSGTPVGGQFAGKANPEPAFDVLELHVSDRRSWQRSDDVVAYTYKADVMCPSCMLKAVPTPNPATHSAESALDILAKETGIDRYDENTFDSDEFPKVVFRDQLTNEVCGECGKRIGGAHVAEVEDALNAYVGAALWSSNEVTGEPLDSSWTTDDFDPTSLGDAEMEVAEFWDRAVAEGLTHHWDKEQFGHDFWLTRNEHGTGFWDRDDGGSGAGEKLTNMAHEYGPAVVEVGDDGKLRFV
jgi:hypothetical protein